MNSIEALLAGSPYLVASDPASLSRLENARSKSLLVRERSIETNLRIKREAQEILGPYLNATRADLVMESNRIEGMDWKRGQVREVVDTHGSLLSGPIHALTETVKADPKLYEVLGLYRAHEIADLWVNDGHVPRLADIRALHHLILGNVRLSGAFKQFENQIEGRADHKTTPPNEVGRVMLDLADWWASSSGDSLLTATTIHAWLAHVHPFEDGNGRIARILANIELARHGHPPLILRASDDRGEYYAALQASDDGDLLPLYELFERVIRRQAKIMSRERYVQDIINSELLASDDQRYQLWQKTLQQFSKQLSIKMTDLGMHFSSQGTLSSDAFALLKERDADGNGWFAKVSRRGQTSEWLMWFGFRSDSWLDVTDGRDKYPSIFVSRRDRSELAVHPYTGEYSQADLIADLPEEIHLIPARGQGKTVCFRSGYVRRDLGPEEAAEELSQIFSSGT